MDDEGGLMKIYLPIAAIMLLVSVLPGTAGEDESVDAGEVVISATLTEEQKLDVTDSVTVITSDEISKSGETTLAGLLDSVPSVYVNDNGGTGMSKSVSIRGSKSTQVLVLINGRRVSGSQSVFDLSLISLNQIERIEIIRGGLSSIHGADAVGGVINIITKKNPDGLIEISLSNVSFLPPWYSLQNDTFITESYDGYDSSSLVDSQTLSAVIAKDFDAAGYSFALSGTRAENDFHYISEKGEPALRTDNAFLGVDGTVSIWKEIAVGTLTAHVFGSYQEKDSPGSTSFPNSGEQHDSKVRGDFSLQNTGLLDEKMTLEINGFYDYSKLEYEDSTVASTHNVHTVSLAAFTKLMLINSMDIVTGLSGGYDYVDSTDVLIKDRLYGGGFAEGIMYINDSFIVQPVVRYDHYSDVGGSINAKLGALLEINSENHLKANISRSFRAPSFQDLYWPEDMFSAGNPDLQPEYGYSLDLGYIYSDESLVVESFIFTRYMEDMILWQVGSDFKYRPDNVSKAVYPGAEISAAFLITDELFLEGLYTFNYSLSLDGDNTIEDDVRVDYVPMHMISSGIVYNGDNDLIRLDGSFVSERYYTDFMGEQQVLDSYLLLDAAYSRELSQNLSLSLSLDNILNVTTPRINGYPVPGFSASTRIRVSF